MIVLIVLGLVLYFLPAIGAIAAKRPGASSIFIVNLFFGWTLIGWVACLAWASYPVKPIPQQHLGPGFTVLPD